MPNSENIDERVVEMRIDNRQFVSGAEKTISILDKLKDALSFKNAGDGFNEVQRAANKLDLSGMADGVDKISSRFSDMGIVGMRVIQNLTDSVYGFVTNTVKGLTIDPVTGGFTKYEDILQKTQTIMSATLNEEIPERFGTQLDYVSNQLELAAWYTDETSASLQDIVGNVSKFTNVGIGLEDAVWEMEGIANWGWSAGASMAEMGRAMYNLSQAMSVGSVKLMDWRSIENANMGTLEFKQTALDTAVALGTLTEVGEGLYKTINGTEVSAKNFNEALSEGWFSSAVLEKTLKLYGEYSRRLGAIMDDAGFSDAGLSASDLISTVDELEEKLASGKYKSLEEGLVAWQNELRDNFSEEDLPGIDALRYAFELLTGDEDALAARAEALGESYNKLSEEQFELTKRAFLMGQEYKTFSDVIDATKDAVSTNWMKTFQLIMGNAEQAKELWSAVGDVFYGIFAEGASRRNAILKWWNSPGDSLESGRDALLKVADGYSSVLGNLYRAIQSFVNPINEAFDKVFSWGTAKGAGDRLRELTYRFRDFTARLALSEEASRGMTNFFTAIFNGAKRVLQIFKPVTSFIGDMIVAIRDAFNLFFESFDNESGKFDKNRFLSGLPGIFTKVSDNVSKALTGIKKFFESFSDVPFVRSVFNFIAKAFDHIINGGKSIVEYLTSAKDGLEGAQTPVQKIKDWFSKIWDYVKNIEFNTDALREGFGKVGEVIQTIYSGLTGDEGDFKERIKTMLKSAMQAVKETLSEIKFSDLLQGARLGIMGYTAIQFAEFVTSFKKTADSFKSIPEAITGGIEKVTKSFAKNQEANVMVKMAAAVLLVAAAIWALSKIPEDKFASIAVTLAFFFTVLSKIAKNISSTKNFSENKNNLIVTLPKFATSLIAIAVLLAAAAAAFLKLKDLEKGDIWKGLLTFLGVMTIAVLAIAAMSIVLKDTDGVHAFGALLGMAIVLYAVVSAMSKLKDLSPEQILATLFGLVLLVGLLSVLMLTATKLTAGNGFGALLVLLSIAVLMNALIPPFLVFANTPWSDVWKAVVMFLAIAATVAIIMLVVSKVGSGAGALKGAASLVLVGVAMVLFSAALLIAAPAILAFAKAISVLMDILMNTEDLGAKLVMLGGFGIALVFLGAGLLAVGAAAVVFAAAAVIAGVGFSLFGAGMLAVAAAIATLTAVLVPFGSVLVEFCETVRDNGALLVGMVSTIIVSVLTAILLSKAKIAYSVVAVILAVIGAIVQNGPQVLTALAQILEQILLFIYQIIPMLLKFLVMTVLYIINGTADALRSNKAALISAIENLVSVIIEVLIETFFRLLGDAFGGLWSFIASFFGEDDGTTGREISNWLAGVGKNASDAIYRTFGGEEREAARAAGAGVPESFMEGIGDYNGAIEGSLQETLVDPVTNATDAANTAASTGAMGLFGSFVDGAGANSENATEQLKAMFGGITGPINTDTTSAGETTGSNWMIGIGNGAMGESEWLNNTMGTLAGDATNAWNTNWGINSPSKVGESIGRFWDLGIVKGLEGGSGDITGTTDSMATRISEAMRLAMANVATLSDEDFNISPVITPVVDMTNVEEGARNASNLLNTQSRLSGVASSADRVSSNLGNLVRNMQAVSEARTNVSNDTYQVNVYSHPGQDEQTIANLVIEQLMSGVVRKGASLG